MVQVRQRSGDQGVNHQNLCSLCYGSPVNFNDTTLQRFSDSIPVTMALINARSLANRSFILKNLLISRDIDFLFVTETSPLSKLSPPVCSFF